MGRVVTLADLPRKPAEEGVSIAPVTAGETSEMSAEYLRIEPRASWRDKPTPQCDCYLFCINGTLTISGNGHAHAMPAQSFAAIQEGVAFTLRNEGEGAAEVLKVLAPPKPVARAASGFSGGLKVAERADLPVVPVPAEHKQRIYFVGHGAAQSKRGHAMIVVYDGATNTPLHHHPDADSLFLLLDGAVQFTVNGEQAVVGAGQATYFPAGDRHGLQTAPGYGGASFLEFHIPADFSTVKV